MEVLQTLGQVGLRLRAPKRPAGVGAHPLALPVDGAGRSMETVEEGLRVVARDDAVRRVQELGRTAVGPAALVDDVGGPALSPMAEDRVFRPKSKGRARPGPQA